MELKEIDEQMSKLQLERSKLLDEEKMKIISSLEWTRSVHAKLEISPFNAAGLPKFEIFLYGKDLPYYSGCLTVMGDSSIYENNMLYSYSSFNRDFPSFYTSSDKMLFRFLELVTFKSFEYDTNTENILNRVKTLSEKYNDRS